jgi:hypothetical protein
MLWVPRSRGRDVVVAAQPDDVLLHGVAVLRRLGARITRYDVEERTAEARLRRFARPAFVRLRAVPAGAAATRLHVESDAVAWAPMFRRFRGALRGVERPAP